MSIQEEGQNRKISFLQLLKENPAVATGVFALGAAVATGILGLGVAIATGIFSVLEKNETGRQELELERIKFEYDLISKILSEKQKLSDEEYQEDSSQGLLFLVNIGIIKSIDAEALANEAKEKNLPSLPALPNALGISSFSDLSEIPAYIRSCRQVITTYGTIEVYDNSSLDTNPANRIGTVTTGTPIRLTGVIRTQSTPDGSTAAQVFLPGRRLSVMQPVGWVDASKIQGCGE